MRFLFYTIFLFFTSSVLAQQTLVPIFSEPQKVGGTINSSSEEVMPYISADGKTMYFSRVFHSANIGGSKAGQDIWYASEMQKKEAGEHLNILRAPLNTKGNNAVVGVADGGNRLYLLNKYGRKGSTSFGLSMSEFQDGQWTEPKEVEIPGLDKLADFYSFWMNPEGDTLLISMQNENTSKEDHFCLFL
jgi:OOP family OmpA-OmpF porin